MELTLFILVDTTRTATWYWLSSGVWGNFQIETVHFFSKESLAWEALYNIPTKSLSMTVKKIKMRVY